LARLIVQPFERAQFLLAPELGVGDRRLQHLDGLVVDLDRHREGMPVLAAVGQ